ncbi:LuxR C-terminal-related transcriptional regulator [Streptomyces durmitorensis]|uniref:Helix-turn-helix transcriptional regulator n=1 Tax=Streptomyces durmitorensis TaxID=319947 RepID=A0ABY4PVA1_9ACTN|nr:helix-turn-helix transcriptional regulator [Streptomyces durmitorensis]UQT57352.1 helix-turn-helix transcriptional regulator [Streptomyces durmitorensis]
MAAGHHAHESDELCQAGMEAYTRALRAGRIHTREVDPTPCLVRFGLLRPDCDDTQWLRPVSPAVALPRLLVGVEDGIAHQRRRKAQLAVEFDQLMSLAPSRSRASSASGISVLQGMPLIEEAIDRATAATIEEIRIIQPGGQRLPRHLADSRPVEQGFLRRGGRMRTLYQHTTRHSLATLAHYEHLQGNVEVRTLDELPQRLFIFDQRSAMIPTREARDIAIELSHPALVAHLTAGYELLWRKATPMYPVPVPLPAQDGVTVRQRAIAGLLIEGHTDSEIATRLGMNVRTARVHIAKLASSLGSQSRAQLGYLISQSGILESDA